jgi:epoxyqueuosine reductase QueG
MKLEAQIKALVLENGAALVGIAPRERLASAPPSADPDYLLPSTHSIISFAIPLDRKVIRNYLSKREWLAHGADQKRIYQKIYTIADRLVDFLKEKGFEAKGVEANNIYRPEPGGTDAINRVVMVPDFSHRYAAVAAGLGRLGWSGNLTTPQFGSAVFLGSVLASAALEGDALLEEDPCEKCKLCTAVCPVEMIDKEEPVSVTIAGREHRYGKKGNNARCLIGCAGYHGLGLNKKWSTWSPYRVDYPLPEEESRLVALSRRLRGADPDKQGGRAFLTQREKCFDPDEMYINTCANCGLICWEKREDRAENQRLLLNSGVAVLTGEGKREAMAAEETRELETPYGVRVAVPRKGIPTMPGAAHVLHGKGSASCTDMDIQVLSFLASKNLEHR